MTDNQVSRRETLKAGALSVAASVPLVGTAGANEHPDASFTFEDQQSDGLSVVVQRVEANIDVRLIIYDGGQLNEVVLSAGVHEDVTIRIPGGITEERTLSAGLYPEDRNVRLGWREAQISVDEDATIISSFGPQLIESEPSAGFEYPYYLYGPATSEGKDPKPLVVESANTGTATNDFEKHRRAGAETARRSLSRDIADSLGAPLLVPVFPRPRGDPVDATHYVHQLDDTTMELDSGPLERVDRQLIRMIEHAQKRLDDREYPVSDEGVMLNGFSASGNFADRFTVLHPEEVISVTAGGLNGMALLPHEQYKGRELPYHVGIANVEELTGQTPDLDALSEVNQFLYMGEKDTNDTIPFDDAWTDDDLRQLALDVYGEDMIADRFPTCQQAYRDAGIEAQFHVYEDTGHTSRPATSDVIGFHRQSLKGEDVSKFGQTIIVTPRVEISAQAPATGDEITFDGSNSTGGVDEVISYQWDFGDGTTATGESTTHTYDDAGTYTVTLRIITDTGIERQTTKTLTVDDAEQTDDETTSANSSADDTEQTDDETSDEDSSADGSGPGFGVPAAFTGLGAAVHLLKSRLAKSDDRD